ncbi:MAG: nuclear transport factor 2 family protein [Candidatus Krumholzibacteriia bacterium]
MRTYIKPMVILVCILVILSAAASAEADDSRWLHQQRLAVGRALVEAQSTSWPAVLPYYTDDIEYHDPIVEIHGIDMMAEFLGRLFGSSPDLVTTIEDETLLGGVYSATWTMVGQFAGVPYTARGISIIKFRRLSARVYYQRDYYSENDIMINIPGLDEAVIGFRTFYRCAVDPTFDCPLKDGATDAGPGTKPLSFSESPAEEAGQDRFLFRLRRQRLQIARALVEIDAATWPTLLRHYTPDIEYHDPIVEIHGIDTMAEFLGRLFSSSPDLVTTVEDESLVGGVYTATWTMTGQFGGVPFSAKGMSIVKFRGWGTRVYYSRDYYTEGDIMANIPGLDEAIAGFRSFYRCAVDPTFDCPPGGPATIADLGRDPADKTEPPRVADTFRLLQNAPNPFNPATEIAFVVPDGGAAVSLRVYDLTGRLVRTLVDGRASAGTHTVRWSGDDDRGQPVASGTYFYQLTAPSHSEIRKMVLLK